MQLLGCHQPYCLPSKSGMKSLFIYSVASLAVLAAMPTFALSGKYFSISSGLVMPDRTPRSIANSNTVRYTPTTPGTSLYQMTNVYWKNSFDNGFPISVTYGKYFLPNWRIEAEFLYQRMQRSTTGTYGWTETNAATNIRYLVDQTSNIIPSTTTPANVYSLLFNGYYDIKPVGSFTPFIGIGAGVAFVKSQAANGTGTLYVDSDLPNVHDAFPINSRSQEISSLGFAYQTKLGLQYMLSKKTRIFAMYRMFATGTLTANSSKFTTTPGSSGPATFVVPSRTISGLIDNNIEVGLSYFLD